ncbi:type VI secretion protein IcmF/TssM N-terminal domain-containing protein [Fundidesulfovibrio terrae]|uniref:type VI secretion protein IcmF/TssM N-terminal domain-containing protein n=1 Tax=Fundidesulfovibrio terrae TaxID=2922866 RepID=UPI001FAF9D68|nr:type VI secretion protein IcmF/TssM N-terminal domain-containing protein [Fundidesulfovibrio terrae]
MKTILLVVLKVILWLLLFAAIGAGAWYLAQWRGWPQWAAVAIGLGAAGLIAGAVFLRRWWFRRRERQFVKRVVEEDTAAISASQGERARLLRDVEDRFAKAVEILRGSQLRREGDPVYVKPWHLVMGEMGSGKSLALRRAKLASILTDVGQERLPAPTRNVDFWFADEAVIIDTAGRYAIPLDEARDREEWERFLALLVKHRRKEPLNGLVLAIAADKAVDATDDVLVEYAKGLRRRVNELMRVIGAKFPVYVMVTKMDHILGMNGLVDQLDDQALVQAMGAVNASTLRPAGNALDEGLARVVSRLKDLRVILPCDPQSMDPAYLMLPGELSRLGERLKVFVGALFAENPYLETPTYRGIFFVSARQEGQAHVMDAGLTDVAAQLSDRAATERGAFLHDVFSRFLPADRNLFTPMLEFLRWRSATRFAGVMAWLFVMFCLAGLLTLAFTHNERALKVISSEFASLPALSGGMDQQLLTVDQFRRQIIRMETVNKDWFLPRMGLTQSLTGEQRVKRAYADLFKSKILDPMDASMRAAVDSLDARASETAIGMYIGHMVWRIELLKAKQRGATIDEMRKIPAYPDAVLAQVDPKLVPELAPFFNDCYLDYLAWEPWNEGMDQRLADFKVRLTRLASLKDGQMQWLVDWANTRPYLRGVTLNDFWGGTGQISGQDVFVPAGYTEEGKTAIESFIKEFDQAVDKPKELQKKIDAFWSWYANQYYLSWSQFAQGFHSGYGFLLDDQDKRKMAARMPTFASPYFAMLEQMATALAAVKKIAPPPPWAAEVMRFHIVLEQARSQSKTEPLLQKEKEKVAVATQRIVGDVDTREAKQFENLLAATAKFQEYQKTLTEMVPSVATQETAFQFVGASMGNPAASGDAMALGAAAPVTRSPALNAETALVGMNALIGVGASADVFTQVVSGPLAFFVLYSTELASCELQRQWEIHVLAEAQGLPQHKYRQALFDKKDGLIWKFVNGPARPFLSREMRGWTAKSWMNAVFPVNRSFLTFLDEGGQETQEALPEYDVTAKTVPTTVNPEARQKPYLTTLTLSCGNQQQILNNYNFLDSAVFKWKTDGCGDTTVTVVFSDLQVSKTYPGVNGFALFLKDFKNGGSKTFTPDDFPGQRDMLGSLGVKRIQVSYVFEGNQPVVRLLSVTPTVLPQTICECSR